MQSFRHSLMGGQVFVTLALRGPVGTAPGHVPAQSVTELERLQRPQSAVAFFHSGDAPPVTTHESDQILPAHRTIIAGEVMTIAERLALTVP